MSIAEMDILYLKVFNFCNIDITETWEQCRLAEEPSSKQVQYRIECSCYHALT